MEAQDRSAGRVRGADDRSGAVLPGLLILVALCASCQKFAEGRQLFHDALVLRDQLVSQFHERDVDVVLDMSKSKMTVKFMNSPLDSATREAKQHRADEVAAFVSSHYNHPLTSVSTQFVSKRGGLSLAETFEGKP